MFLRILIRLALSVLYALCVLFLAEVIAVRFRQHQRQHTTKRRLIDRTIQKDKIEYGTNLHVVTNLSPEEVGRKIVRDINAYERVRMNGNMRRRYRG